MTERILSVGVGALTHFDRAMHELGVTRTLEILNAAFAAAGDAVIVGGGRIVKYIGDAIMFTVDDATAGQAIAKAIVACFDHREGGLHLQWHVAVATGPVTECTVGHASHRTADIYGATVNDAFRLMKKAYSSPDRVAFAP
jgi:class 3 adenylate cyclase